MNIQHEFKRKYINIYDNVCEWNFYVIYNNIIYKGSIHGEHKPGSLDRIYTGTLESTELKLNCGYVKLSFGYSNILNEFKYIIEAMKDIIVNHNYTIVSKYGQVKYFPK